MSPAYKHAVRYRKWKAAGKKCAYCRRSLALECVTLDHIVPKALGGSGSPANQCCCCFQCNQKKGKREQHEFHAALMMGCA